MKMKLGKIKTKLQNLFVIIKRIFKSGYILFARILIILGQEMIKEKKPYSIITKIIENLLISLDVDIKVKTISDHPLYVRFTVEISSASPQIVDWRYFTMELIYQLGAELNDVVIEKNKKENNGKQNIYNIDITKTAIANLEKGITINRPVLFDEDNTMTIMKKAVKLAKDNEITPELLEKTLKINSFRARLLYEQLKNTNITRKNKTVIN
jgi:hypothetical protein